MARQLEIESIVRPSARSSNYDYLRRVFLGSIASVIVSVGISAGVWLLAVGIPSGTASSETRLSAVFQWIYHTQSSTAIRESLWVFPAIEGTHLLGIALSAGALCWFDLRLLGFALCDEKISRVWKYVMPVAFVGFGLVFITGFLLFWAEAATAYHSVHFWIKMGLIVVAGINAFLFESRLHPQMAEWDTAAVPPRAARVAGVVSLVLWTAIMVTGRTMAYSF
jgi:hypothetical protein